jgi:hypothetical protein
LFPLVALSARRQQGRNIMKRIDAAAAVFTATAALALATSSHATTRLFSIDLSEPRLWVIDPSSAYAPVAHTITVENHTVCGGRGLATQPTTGTLYATVTLDDCSSDGQRTLITLDPLTGVGTIVDDIGSSSNRITNIAFADQNTLYAVSGNSATLFQVDLATAALTKLCMLRAGSGHALAFGDGVLYHGVSDCNLDSSCPGVLDEINPADFPVDNTEVCPFTGYSTNSDFFSPDGMVFVGSDGGVNQLYIADAGSLYSAFVVGQVNPADLAYLTYHSHNSKGLALSDAAVALSSITMDVGTVKYRTKGTRFVEYDILAKNYGPDAATNVFVVSYIPTGTAFVTSNNNCFDDNGSIRCDLGTIEANSSELAALVFEVLCKKCSSIEEYVTIDSDDDIWDYPFDNAFFTTTSVKGKF